MAFKKRIENTFVQAIFSIILILYICGITVRNLKIGFWICIVLGLCCIAYIFFSLYKDKSTAISFVKENILTPGLLIIFLAFIFVSAINRNRMFSYWDEFSHWGTCYKNMYIFDRLSNYKYSTDIFKSYPPATALFEYFFAKFFGGGYHEAYAYRANDLLMAATLLPAIGKYSWKEWKKAFAFFGILFLLPIVFYQYYLNKLIVDIVLAFLFSYNLFIAFFYKRKEAYYYFSLFLGLSLLCLTKASGAFYAIIVIALVFIDVLRDKSKPAFIKSIIAGVGGFLAGRGSWLLYLRYTGTTNKYGTITTTSDSIKDIVAGNAEAWRYTTIKNFFSAFGDRPLSSYIVSIATIPWLAICGILFAICCLLIERFGLNKSENESETLCTKRLHCYALICFFGLILYSIGLLSTYLFSFQSEYIGITLDSFERYMSTYIVGMLLFFVAFISMLCNTEVFDYRKVFIARVMACVLWLILPISSIFTIYTSIGRAADVRARYGSVEKYVKELDYQKDKVAIVSQGDSGFDMYLLWYELTPVQVDNVWKTNSFGKVPYKDTDDYTKDMNGEEWIQKLLDAGDTCVYCYHVDDQFTDLYGGYFESEPEDLTMYRLVKNGESTRLKKIE